MSALSAPPKTGIWFCGHFIDPSKRPTGDLARWGARCFHPDNHNELVEIPLILKPVQLQFLERAMVKYGFTDLNEVYRHLVFVSNVVEVPAKKKIIFKKIRCLHCAVGNPKEMHERITVKEGARVFGFQRDWLEVIRRKCSESGGEKDLGKVGRILCDYYGLYGDLDEAAAATSKEGVNMEVDEKHHRSVFLYNRMFDARAVEALQAWDRMEAEARSSSSGAPAAPLGDKSAVVPNLPEHCRKYSASVQETVQAVEKCQVGRGSTSYSLARGETNEETLLRRKKEIETEQSEEAREQREIIKKALGSVMG